MFLTNTSTNTVTTNIIMNCIFTLTYTFTNMNLPRGALGRSRTTLQCTWCWMKWWKFCRYTSRRFRKTCSSSSWVCTFWFNCSCERFGFTSCISTCDWSCCGTFIWTLKKISNNFINCDCRIAFRFKFNVATYSLTM